MVMQAVKPFFILCCLFSFVFSISIPPVVALDPNTGTQDRYSSCSKGQFLSPSGREPVTKKQPTIEQNFHLLFSKVSKLEQQVKSLQSRVAVQT